MLLQLDFFEEDDISLLKTEMREVKDSCTRVRKSQFAKIGELNKIIIDLKSRLDILESNICRRF